MDWSHNVKVLSPQFYTGMYYVVYNLIQPDENQLNRVSTTYVPPAPRARASCGIGRHSSCISELSDKRLKTGMFPLLRMRTLPFKFKS